MRNLYHTSHLLNAGLRLFFRLLYHQIAWGYDLVADVVSLGMWKSWVLSILPHVQGHRVLEIGHGPGHLMMALIRMGIGVVGLDASVQMGRIVLRRLRDGKFGLVCINGYAQAMPFPDNTFNTVCSTFPSDYILDPATLSEVHRTLVPSGCLVVLPVAWITQKGLLGSLAASFFRAAGLAPEWDNVYAQPLINAGFQVSILHHDLPSSRVLILIATKNE